MRSVIFTTFLGGILGFSSINVSHAQTVGVQLYTFGDLPLINSGNNKKPEPGIGGSIGLSAFTDSTEVGASPNFMLFFDYGFPTKSEVKFPFENSQTLIPNYQNIPVTTSFFRAGISLGIAYERHHKYRYPCISFGFYGTKYNLTYHYNGPLEPSPTVTQIDSSSFKMDEGGGGVQFTLQKFYTQGKLDFFWSTSMMVNVIEIKSSKHLETIPILFFNLSFGIRLNVKELIEKASIY